jgi:hypothetical protein
MPDDTCHYFTRFEMCCNAISFHSVDSFFIYPWFACFELGFTTLYLFSAAAIGIYLSCDFDFVLYVRTKGRVVGKGTTLPLFDYYLRILAWICVFGAALLYFEYFGGFELFENYDCALQQDGLLNGILITILNPLLFQLCPLRLLMLHSLSKRCIIRVVKEASFFIILTLIFGIVDLLTAQCETEVDLMDFWFLDTFRLFIVFPCFVVLPLLISNGNWKIRPTGVKMAHFASIYNTYILLDRILSYSFCQNFVFVDKVCENFEVRMFLRNVRYLIYFFTYPIEVYILWVTFQNESQYWRGEWESCLNFSARKSMLKSKSVIPDDSAADLADVLDDISGNDSQLIDASTLEFENRIGKGSPLKPHGVFHPTFFWLISRLGSAFLMLFLLHLSVYSNIPTFGSFLS